MVSTSVSLCSPGSKWGNGETPETSGKKGDHLIGDYYVAFDKHYREGKSQSLKAQYMKEGMDEEAATEKAKVEAPLIKEAHEMLVKWENNDPGGSCTLAEDEQLGLRWLR